MKAGPERNQLLASLPQQVKDRVFPLLREIDLPLGKEVSASGQEVQYVYFPADCIISLLCIMLDGHSAEISIVGCEGVLGVEVFMGGGAAHPARPLSSTPVRPTGCRPPTSRTNSTTMQTCACCCCAIPRP